MRCRYIERSAGRAGERPARTSWSSWLNSRRFEFESAVAPSRRCCSPTTPSYQQSKTNGCFREGPASTYRPWRNAASSSVGAARHDTEGVTPSDCGDGAGGAARSKGGTHSEPSCRPSGSIRKRDTGSQPQSGGKDVFVHISAIEKAGHARPRRKISKFSDDG
jgi:hypothetical protein